MMNFTLSNQVQDPGSGNRNFYDDTRQAEQAVVDALACGYRMIDTAQAYMNERAVGRGIKRSGVAREDIFISTKIWVSQYLTEGTVEKSLELLGTDYIDLMFIHQLQAISWQDTVNWKRHTKRAKSNRSVFPISRAKS